jgi:hypothetical protein
LIRAYGGQGGSGGPQSGDGGFGAGAGGDIILTAGTEVEIVVDGGGGGGDFADFWAGGGGGGTFIYTVVPEPSTWAMTLLGFSGLGFAASRRRSARRRAMH